MVWDTTGEYEPHWQLQSELESIILLETPHIYLIRPSNRDRFLFLEQGEGLSLE